MGGEEESVDGEGGVGGTAELERLLPAASGIFRARTSGGFASESELPLELLDTPELPLDTLVGGLPTDFATLERLDFAFFVPNFAFAAT